MGNLKKVWKILLVVCVLTVIVAIKVIYAKTILGTIGALVIVLIIEFVGVWLVKRALSSELPDDKDKREDIIKSFSRKNGLNLNDKDIRIIAEASYSSSIWADEVMAMTKTYLDLGEWLGGKDKTIWLRVYLYTFPVKDITSDYGQLYGIAVDRDFKNLANEINEKEFMTIDECIRSINNSHYLNFDKKSFALFTYVMRKNGKKIVLADVGQVGFEDEMAALIRKYS